MGRDLRALLAKRYLSVLFVPTGVAPRAPYTWCGMQGWVVRQGIKTVGREPCWCRPNPEYHEIYSLCSIPN